MLRDQLKPTLRLAIPVVLAELGWMGMGVVDTIMVAPLGPAAIAGAGVGNSIHLGFAIFGMGLLLGLDTLVAQAYGAGNRPLCRAWLHTGVRLALLATLPLMAVLGVVWSMLPVLGFHPDTQPLLSSYLGIMILSTPLLLLYAAFRRFLQSIHHVRPVMFALLSANVINAVANYALIHGHFGVPALGVPGAALATLVSRAYMCGLLGVVAWTINRRDVREEQQALAARGEVPPPAPRTTMRRLIELGLPAASTVTAEVGVFALATALAGQLEPVSTAAHQIAINIAAVTFMVPLGLASAGAVRVGHAVGADNPRGAAAAGWTVIVFGVAFMCVSGLTFVLVPERLIALFTTNADVILQGSRLLLIGAVFQLFDGLQGVVTGTLRGLGDTRTPMFTNLTAHWLIGLPIGYSLCFVAGWGASGLWWGLSAGLIVAAVVLTTVWSRRVAAYQRTGRLK